MEPRKFQIGDIVRWTNLPEKKPIKVLQIGTLNDGQHWIGFDPNIEGGYFEKVFTLVERAAPPPVTDAGADEYEEIMRIQEHGN